MTKSEHTTAELDELAPQALGVWYSLLRAYAGIIRQLDAELRTGSDLTINDYDVLVHLRDADSGCLRMGCLAERIVLSRSGMTRLIDGLVKDGLVERKACGSDARGSWAVITDKGRQVIADARTIHLAGVRRLFADHVSDDEFEVLGRVFERVIAVKTNENGQAIPSACDPVTDEPGCP